MKSLLTLPCTLATAMLLGLPWAAGAQALGNIKADAFIGRPLEASLPITLEQGTDPCVRAEVSFGDSKLPPEQVSATVLGAPGAQRVRVQTSLPIDEPVVTVAVRAGCGSSMTRSFTLLPEYPTQVMLADAGTSRVRPPAEARAPVAQRASGAPPKLKARASSADAAIAARPPHAPRSIIKAKLPAGARLQLEAWDPDPQAILRVSSTLSPPQEGAGRATAAALWQAINASPEQLLRTSANLQQMEGELARLRQAAGHTHDDVLALRRDLEAPQPLDLPAQGIKLLALLLALGAGTLAILWWRARQGAAGEWSGASLGPVFAGLEPAPVQRAAQAAAVQPVPPVKAAPAMQPQPVPAAPLLHRPMATLLRVETLAATFDEVDFLSSLGLWNDAMDVLKGYLEDSAAPAPLAYYELMRLCVHLDDAGSLQAVRKRYAQVFGVDAPKFEQVSAPLGIESYPELAGRLTAGWGRHDALDFIELTLFTVAPPGKAFSLQAGRDLLFLHDLAMAELREGESGDGHAIAPWANADDPRHALDAMPDVASHHRFALDLDLDQGTDDDELRDSEPAPVELAPRRPAVRRPEPEPEATDSMPLAFDIEAFDAAVATERLRRK